MLTQRIVLLAVLIVVVVGWLMYLSANGYLSGDYDFDYLSASLIDAVPLALLGFAELVVIVSGRGGIDLSVGAMVSLVGMVFGFAHGTWNWPLPAAIVVAVVVGGLLGRSTDSSSPESDSPPSSRPWPPTTPTGRSPWSSTTRSRSTARRSRTSTR